MRIEKEFQFDNSNKSTTMKRSQCSLYLGQEITANSLPFTCLKNVKYQHVPGTEIPNAILWGWNQLSNINCPHPPTAIADRFHWLLLHINTGNGTSLKNKVHGGLAYSKCTGLLTELSVPHSHRYKMCLKWQRISSFQETQGCSPAWPQPLGRHWQAGRGRQEERHTGLHFSVCHRSLLVRKGRLKAKQIIPWKQLTPANRLGTGNVQRPWLQHQEMDNEKSPCFAFSLPWTWLSPDAGIWPEYNTKHRSYVALRRLCHLLKVWSFLIGLLLSLHFWKYRKSLCQ